MQNKPLLPISAAQLTEYIKSNLNNADAAVYVQAAETLRNGLLGAKEYKCLCADGAGSGTRTINGVKHLCEGCEGRGYSDVPMKIEPTIVRGVIVNVVKRM